MELYIYVYLRRTSQVLETSIIELKSVHFQVCIKFSQDNTSEIRMAPSIFSPWDYLAFGLMLFLSASIGIYYSIMDRKGQSTIQGYFFGGRSLHPLPVAFSLMASFIGAPIMLGGPAEVYTQGTMIYYMEIAIILSLVLATSTFIPFFLKLKVTSIFEVLSPFAY